MPAVTKVLDMGLASVGSSMEHASSEHGHGYESLNRSAVRATLHCLTGCAIGEVFGDGDRNRVGLGQRRVDHYFGRPGFFLRVLVTIGPILRAGVPFRRAAGLTVASDTISIATMELVDNAFLLIVPGAIAAGLLDRLFWWACSLASSSLSW